MTDSWLKDNSHLNPTIKMCTTRLTFKEQKDFHFWRNTCTEGTCCHIKGYTPMAWINQLKSIKHTLELCHANVFSYPYILRHYESLIIPCFYSFHLQASTMDALQYWPFAHEYSIWNATVRALQFWMADLEPHIFSNARDWVHTAFFYSDTTQQIHNIPEKILFGHFVTTLNATFETDLAQEDEGYESGSVSINSHMPLHRNWESTMSQKEKHSPLILQTLVNHQPHQSTMKKPHLADTDVAAVHAANWCSPVLVMKVPRDTMNAAASTPAPMLVVQYTEEQNPHLHCTTICITPWHSHQPQSSPT